MQDSGTFLFPVVNTLPASGALAQVVTLSTDGKTYKWDAALSRWFTAASGMLLPSDADWFDSPSAYAQFAAAIKLGTAKVVFVGDSLTFGYQSAAQASLASQFARRLKLLYPTVAFSFVDRAIPGWGFLQFLGSTSASYPSNSAIGSAAPSNRPGRNAWNVNTSEEPTYRWPEGAASFTATTWLNVVKADNPDLVVVLLGFNDMVGGNLPIKTGRDDLAGLYTALATLRTISGAIPSICLGTPHTGNPASGTLTVPQQDKLRGMNQQTRQTARAFDSGILDAGRTYDRIIRGVDPLRFKFDTERYLDGFADATKWQADYYNNNPSSSPVSGAGTSGVAIDSTGLHSALAIANFCRKVPAAGAGMHFNLRKLATANDQAQVSFGGYRSGSTLAVTERMVISLFNQSGVGKVQWAMDNSVLQTVSVAAFPTNGSDNYWVGVLWDGSQIYVWLNGNTSPNAPDATFQLAGYAPGYAGIGYANLSAGPAVKITDIVMQFAQEAPTGGASASILEVFGVGPVEDYLSNNLALGGDADLHPSTLGYELLYDAAITPVLNAIKQAYALDQTGALFLTAASVTVAATHDKKTVGLSRATLQTVTVPGPSSAAMPVGFRATYIREGVGSVHFTPSGADCSILYEPGADTIGQQYRSVELRLISATASAYVYLLVQTAAAVVNFGGQSLYLGAHYNGTDTRPEGTSASALIQNTITGALEFYADTGLTANVAYSPTLRASLLPTGLTLAVPLALGANKITGLANGSAASDAAAFGQIPTGTMGSQNANAVAITGGAMDGTPIGANTKASGAFTTLTANGAVTFTSASGTVLALGNTTDASSASPVVLSLGGTYSDTAGAKPKIRLYDSGGTALGFGFSLNQFDYIAHSAGAHAFWSGSLKSLMITSAGNLVFPTDNTQDIGASGATRPRDFFLGRNAVVGGTLGVTGIATFTVAPVFTDASGSRTALGLGTMATQAASAVAITGGSAALTANSSIVKSANAATALTITNINGGTAAIAYVSVTNDASLGYLSMNATGTAYSNNGAYKTDAGVIDCGSALAGGLSIIAQTAPIRFYAGGILDANLVAQINAGNLTMTGDVKLGTAGNGLYVKEGSNATMGTGTLASGTLVVSTTKVTASSRIFLTDQGGTVTNLGSLYVSARSAGTSFTVSSSNVLDASTFAWLIVEPA